MTLPLAIQKAQDQLDRRNKYCREYAREHAMEKSKETIENLKEYSRKYSRKYRKKNRKRLNAEARDLYKQNKEKILECSNEA